MGRAWCRVSLVERTPGLLQWHAALQRRKVLVSCWPPGCQPEDEYQGETQSIWVRGWVFGLEKQVLSPEQEDLKPGREDVALGRRIWAQRSVPGAEAKESLGQEKV